MLEIVVYTLNEGFSSLMRRRPQWRCCDPPPNTVRSSTDRPIEPFTCSYTGLADWLTGYFVKQQAAPIRSTAPKGSLDVRLEATC